LLSSDPKSGTYKSPLFYTFKLFSNNCLGDAVDTYVACDTFNTEKYKGIPYLDVSAVYSKTANAVFINVVNRHKDKAIEADIMSTSGTFSGKGEASTLNATSITEPFAFEKRDQYLPVKKEITLKKGNLNYSFPPHSFTQIRISIDK
jgi:alpha-N-arabinofuranosidase